MSLSPFKSKESLSVCVSVCVSNISADQDQTDLRFSTWLLRGLRVCNIAFVWTTMIPLINNFRNALWIPLALSTIATCTPEPITAELIPRTFIPAAAQAGPGFWRWFKSRPSLFGSEDIQMLLAISPRPRPTSWVDRCAGTSKTGLTVNNVRPTFSQTLLSRLLVSGAGRNSKNGLLSRKCTQPGGVCKQKNTFLLVEKGTTPTYHKIIWQTTWFGCWGTGEVVGETSAKDLQQQWWRQRQQVLKVERFVTYSVFGV